MRNLEVSYKTSDHESSTGPTKRILQYSGQLALSIGHSWHVIVQCINNVWQGKEGLVDLATLLDSSSLIASSSIILIAWQATRKSYMGTKTWCWTASAFHSTILKVIWLRWELRKYQLSRSGSASQYHHKESWWRSRVLRGSCWTRHLGLYELPFSSGSHWITPRRNLTSTSLGCGIAPWGGSAHLCHPKCWSPWVWPLAGHSTGPCRPRSMRSQPCSRCFHTRIEWKTSPKALALEAHLFPATVKAMTRLLV